MANRELRKLARINEIPQWKIAKQLGVTEMTLYRWMREELEQEKAAKIRAAIEELAGEMGEMV